MQSEVITDTKLLVKVSIMFLKIIHNIETQWLNLISSLLLRLTHITKQAIKSQKNLFSINVTHITGN